MDKKIKEQVEDNILSAAANLPEDLRSRISTLELGWKPVPGGLFGLIIKVRPTVKLNFIGEPEEM